METQQVQVTPKNNNKTVIWIIIAIVVLISLCSFCGLIGGAVYLLTNATVKDDNSGTMCGGIANIQCPSGYVCESTAMYPDASGTCVKNDDVIVPTVTNFEECMDAGGLIMESYPRQCNFQDGQTFIEEIILNEEPVLYTISGTVNFPSEFMPDMEVCAYNVSDEEEVSCTNEIEKEGNRYMYSMQLPEGSYYIDAEALDGSGFVGIYSDYAKCTLEVLDASTCLDESHKEIPVEVGPGVGDVDYGPVDWYYE